MCSISQEGRQEDTDCARQEQGAVHTLLQPQDGPHCAVVPRHSRLLRGHYVLDRSQGEPLVIIHALIKM
jgi:hypothetical protein